MHVCKGVDRLRVCVCGGGVLFPGITVTVQMKPLEVLPSVGRGCTTRDNSVTSHK